MSQIATQVLNVNFADYTPNVSEVLVFEGSRIVFSIENINSTLQFEFMTADGSARYLLYTAIAGATLQANLLFDRGLLIRTYSGATHANALFVINTSAPGA